VIWLGVVHKYRDESQFTVCGRYVEWEEGSSNLRASDKDHEITCKSCNQIAMGRVCGRWVGEM